MKNEIKKLAQEVSDIITGKAYLLLQKNHWFIKWVEAKDNNMKKKYWDEYNKYCIRLRNEH